MRAVAVSGDGQRERAFVSNGSATYETQFPQPLLVRVEGPAMPPSHPRHVVFTCISKGCAFPGTEQRDLYDYLNRVKDTNDKPVENAYDTREHGGRAGLYVAVRTRVPAGTYTIRAMPVANRGERAVATVFTLTSY